MNKELSKRLLSSILILPIVFLCIIAGSYYFNLLIVISFIMSVYEWNLMNKKKFYRVYGLIFLSFSYISIFLIRNDFGEQSLNFLLHIILICILTDLGGYIFGKLFKGPKLTNISPKKTYSGMLGSFLLPLLILVLIYKYNYFTNYQVQEVDTNFIFILLIISAVSQIGDLIISYFKRLAKIKDTGKIIPGHGGILDRTDGMIFAFPFSYILLTLNLFE